jgi:hypothetical protein
MICASSLYERCHKLFAGYPLAIFDDSGPIRSMVLILPSGEDAEFFVLLQECAEGGSSFSLCPWPAEGLVDTEAVVDIEADGAVPVPDVAVEVVTRGVPIPRHGSVFGWSFGDVIAALIPVYAEYSPAYPQPHWSVMPLAGSRQAQWPPFTGERLFGSWFWEHYQAGCIISLDSLIAGTRHAVFWVDTRAILGSDCCVVSSDIRSPEGPTLRRGRYVYHETLRAGTMVPSLSALLADTGKTDLGPRFQQSGYSDSWSLAGSLSD